MDEHKFSILIVDDNPKNLQVLGNTLKNRDYKVEFAINGYKALEWLEQRSFDLVLLDVMMPEMDGYEVCRKLRDKKSLENTPVIFLTAKSDTEGVVKGFEAGAQDYITKPFNTPELLIRVKTQLELKDSREKLQSVNKWLETEVKLRTEELEASNQKLEKANTELLLLDKTKTDFLNTISNELRGPLNGILGTLNILKDQADSKKMVDLINMLDSSVNRLEKYSSYALLVTRLKTNKYTLNPRDINLSELIELGLIKVGNLLKEKAPELDKSKVKDLTIKADYDLLLLVVQILLENSLKRLDKNGKLSLIVQNVEGKTKLEVHDNGVGLPSDILQGNYDTFQPPADYPAKDIGTGFHLISIIAEKHGMEFNLTSEKNKSWVVITM